LKSSGICEVSTIDSSKTKKIIFASGINGINASQIFTFLLNASETYRVYDIKTTTGRLYHYMRPLIISKVET